MFDLIVDTISLEAGQERKSLPGLWVGVAPRRAARLRGQDRVMFFFSQSGTVLLAPNLQQEMLTRLAETYFNTSGSVTAGMLVTAERLNDFLLNRNLRGARQGGTVVGALAMAVLHGSSLYVLLAGSTHAYLVTQSQVEHFQDPAARGLGQAKMVSQRFFTATLEAAGLLLFSAEPSGEWTDGALRSSAGLAGEELRHRLISQALNLTAGIVRCQPGKGVVTWTTAQRVEPQKAVAVKKADSLTQSAPTGASIGAKLSGIFLSGKALKKEGVPPTGGPHTPAAPPVAPPAREVAGAVRPAVMVSSIAEPAAVDHMQPASAAGDLPQPAQPAKIITNEQSQARVPVRKQPPAAGAQVKPPAAKVQAQARPQGPSPAMVAAAKLASDALGGVRRAWRQFTGAASRLIARAIPGQPVEGLNIPPSSMLMIALAVPLVVVAVAATVYFQRGRGEQYQAYLQTAQQFADKAAAQEDQDLRREDWNQTLYWLDKAGGYGESEQGDELQQMAQAGLDSMEGITRLNYLPAGDPMPEGTHITRMVASVNDVYMLDTTTGSVYRLYRTGNGYELDLQFQCGPGKAGAVQIGPLLDIVALPPNNDFQATVMGIDAGGNLEYCAPGAAGFSSTMLVPPDNNWGQITHMVLYQDVLYVMDPMVNAVYRYYGDRGSAFTSGPRYYFENQVPKMADVIDMAVDQEYLYLLHENGSMTTCSDAGFTTTCDDPATYGDPRQGRPSEPVTFEDAKFLLLQSTQPPDPSLYILDEVASAVYQFSLRKLNLQRQYRPMVEQDYPLPETAVTGFTMTPNRKMMLAFGNQAFYAPLP